MYVCIYTHTHTHTYKPWNIHTYIHPSMYACMHTYGNIYIYMGTWARVDLKPRSRRRLSFSATNSCNVCGGGRGVEEDEEWSGGGRGVEEDEEWRRTRSGGGRRVEEDEDHTIITPRPPPHTLQELEILFYWMMLYRGPWRLRLSVLKCESRVR